MQLLHWSEPTKEKRVVAPINIFVITLAVALGYPWLAVGWAAGWVFSEAWERLA